MWWKKDCRIDPTTEDRFMNKRSGFKIKKAVKSDRIEVMSVTSQDLANLERTITNNRQEINEIADPQPIPTIVNITRTHNRFPNIIVFLLLLLVLGLLVVIALCVIIFVKETSRSLDYVNLTKTEQTSFNNSLLASTKTPIVSTFIKTTLTSSNNNPLTTKSSQVIDLLTSGFNTNSTTTTRYESINQSTNIIPTSISQSFTTQMGNISTQVPINSSSFTTYNSNRTQTYNNVNTTLSPQIPVNSSSFTSYNSNQNQTYFTQVITTLGNNISFVSTQKPVNFTSYNSNRNQTYFTQTYNSVNFTLSTQIPVNSSYQNQTYSTQVFTSFTSFGNNISFVSTQKPVNLTSYNYNQTYFTQPYNSTRNVSLDSMSTQMPLNSSSSIDTFTVNFTTITTQIVDQSNPTLVPFKTASLLPIDSESITVSSSQSNATLVTILFNSTTTTFSQISNFTNNYSSTTRIPITTNIITNSLFPNFTIAANFSNSTTSSTPNQLANGTSNNNQSFYYFTPAIYSITSHQPITSVSFSFTSSNTNTTNIYQNYTASMNITAVLKNTCLNFGTFDAALSKCNCLESTYGEVCQYLKPCEKLRQDPFQCSNLTYEPLAYLVCPMKFRCSNQSNDSMIMSSSSTIQYPKAGQDVTESPTTKMSNPRVLVTLTANVCWNSGFYDYSKSKCICFDSTYGDYCEYFKPCDSLASDPIQCKNITFNSFSYILCPQRFRCSNVSNLV